MSGPYPYFGPTGVIDYINEYRFEGKFALIGEDGDHFLKFATQPMTLIARGQFNVNNHAHVLGGRDGNSIHWFQRFYEYRDVTQNLTRQGANRYKLTKAALKKLPIAIPTPAEQHAITDALDDASQLISLLERLITKKQAIRQGMMQQLLAGHTRLPGFSGSWAKATLGEFSAIDPEALTSDTDSKTVIDYISLEDVERGDLLGYTRLNFGSAPSRARRVIHENDVLFGTVRPNLQSHALYVGGLSRPIASTGFAVVRGREKTDPRFIFYLLMSDFTSVQVDRIISGSNYPAVSSADVRRLTFAFPPFLEQQAIGSVLADSDQELSGLRHRLVKTKAIQQGMLQQLLTGRTRLPIPEAVA